MPLKLLQDHALSYRQKMHADNMHIGENGQTYPQKEILRKNETIQERSKYRTPETLVEKEKIQNSYRIKKPKQCRLPLLRLQI